FNFTDVQLLKEVEGILTLEPGFGIPLTPRQVPVEVLIKDLENGLRFVDIAGSDLKAVKEEQSNIRSKVVYLISNYYRKNHRKQSTGIIADFKATKYFLKKHPDLIITRSDKGGNTVIMYKEEYQKEMYKLLEDKDTYLQLNKDPTSKYERMANDLVAKLKTNSIISEDLEKEFKNYNSVSPKLYGLRKTHKPGCVMRPVVSSIKSPCYKIARFLHQILSTSLSSRFVFSIKNSFEFVKFTKEVRLPKDYVLVSLDVVVLFTNIPKQLVKDIINEDWHELSGLIKIPKDILLEIIQFCFDSSYLQFNGACYQQLDGSSMGNPASPILANIVMDHILKKII
ncbi:GSCOCG00012914001-RA-CDS, partial [Cotesia congregata]